MTNSYKDTVLPIIRETREILLSGFGTAPAIGQKSAHPADVVTEIDRKVENFLNEKLGLAHPDIVFVGEEFGGDRKALKYWLADPIDATGHYIRGVALSTSMLALIENGEVVFSVIYDFVNDNIYWAEKGKGAYRNEERIYVSDREPENAYIVCETHLEKEKNQKKFLEFANTFAHLETICAGWEYAMIASGKLDGRAAFDPWGKDYDFAPGTLLVSEAGGVVQNLNSDKYDFNREDRSHIAANPKVAIALQKFFADYE